MVLSYWVCVTEDKKKTWNKTDAIWTTEIIPETSIKKMAINFRAHSIDTE